MYQNFSNLELPDNIDNFFAHRKDSKKRETLKEHSDLTKHYLNLLVKEKNLPSIIESLLKLLKNISKDNFDLLKKMFYNAVYLHDLGKTNPSFQRNKMDNKLFEETTASSNHSLLSAEKYIELFEIEIENKQIKGDNEYYCLIYVLYSFAYQISKHHGKLTSFEKFITNCHSVNLNNAYDSIKELNIPEFEFYILNKLLFSLLISSDYYATSEYMADLITTDFGLLSDSHIKLLSKEFESFNIIENIRLFEKGEFEFKNNDINKLRCEIFLESEQNLKKNISENIFYLEAPTGSGKTLTSINLALQLLKNDENLNKLFYIFPFNTLVEQTKKTFDDIFKTINIEIINSITPIEDGDDYNETNYDKSYVNRLFFHNPIILTTHISLFNILFGTSKDDTYPLWQLANSVIIIDEIQSYNNNLWWYMIEFFQKYAKSLNIKIIIMSATLPKLDSLLDNTVGFVDLIKNSNYFFQNKLFKNRVLVDFSLLNSENFQNSEESRKKRIDNLLSVFDQEISLHNKFLFEFIKKDTAREFYNILEKSAESFEVYELTGDDNKAYREFVISKTKENIKIIVVATQVIEAGVDIDMDVGFKDISTLDSEEQFMGRINRNCKKENSKVYFFYLDDEQKIYNEDNRLEFNLRTQENQYLLKEKKFQDFYKKVLNRIEENGNSIREGLNSEIENFKKHVTLLSYKKISETMTLINSQNHTLFFPFKIDITQYKIKEFENIDNSLLTEGLLDGKKVWEIYKELIEIKRFSEMKVKKSRINTFMQFFTFNIVKYDESLELRNWTEEFGGIYYIRDYQEYITRDLKFNRKRYQEDCKSTFY